MGCGSCSSGGCSPEGCGNKGHCTSGGCNKKNSFDWLSILSIPEEEPESLAEISFKNGTRKGIFKYEGLGLRPGSYVTVQSDVGHDIGKVTLTGTLARLQLKKYKKKAQENLLKIYRISTTNDLDKLVEARKKEPEILIKARKIAKELNLDMKIGEVEYQADKKKITFYYTAEGRVDFRALVKTYIQVFKGKIEMRQIGIRQEAGLVGGIGSCGRELCCSTWLNDFKLVSTSAARYQNISINTDRISGQCGRLKCCLNYELDTYMEAFQAFPKDLRYLKTPKGKARVVKTDILKKLLYFSYENSSTLIPLHVDEAKRLGELSKRNKTIPDLEHDNSQTNENRITKDNIDEININILGRRKQKERNKNKKRKKNRFS